MRQASFVFLAVIALITSSSAAGDYTVDYRLASAGLATVARALFDRRALAQALRLGEHEEVLLTQTIGYPAS